MAFPPEFDYANEDDFIQRLLIPMLSRLGYSIVMNYHGQQEYGKDLVFGEIDRFGHVVYHGLQAKYTPSISLNAVEEIISDAKQAFNTPFRHPHKGNEERISTFFAVNGGSISSDATVQFFNTLLPQYGANIRLMDGKALVALDKLANTNRAWVGETLTGVLLEIRKNREVSAYLVEQMDKNINHGGTFPIARLRVNAVEAYLERPIPERLELHEVLHEYWQSATAINEVAESMGASVTAGGWKQSRLEGLRMISIALEGYAMVAERLIDDAMATLTPLINI